MIFDRFFASTTMFWTWAFVIRARTSSLRPGRKVSQHASIVNSIVENLTWCSLAESKKVRQSCTNGRSLRAPIIPVQVVPSEDGGDSPLIGQIDRGAHTPKVSEWVYIRKRKMRRASVVRSGESVVVGPFLPESCFVEGRCARRIGSFRVREERCV
jgi:hypothetical protein